MSPVQRLSVGYRLCTSIPLSMRHLMLVVDVVGGVEDPVVTSGSSGGGAPEPPPISRALSTRLEAHDAASRPEADARGAITPQ